MSTPRHSTLARSIGAIFCGLTAGIMLLNSMQVGFGFTVSAEMDSWTWMIWGEHWAVRGLASVAASFLAGCIAGAVARSRGRLLAAVSAVPSALLWTYFAFAGWSGTPPFLEGYDIDMSLGNSVMSTVLALITVPIAAAGGEWGETFGEANSEHFDGRRGTLLGVRWYQYLWIPFVLHLVIAQTFWAVLYGLPWVMLLWRASERFLYMIPFLFMMGIWGTLVLVWLGVSKAYFALTALEEYESRSRIALAAIKYGLGFPALGAGLQAGIVLLHLGLIRLIS